MPMRYKFDVLVALKRKGLSTYKIMQEKIFGQSTVQKLRTGKPVDWQIIEKLCFLLECQPGDILEYVEDE